MLNSRRAFARREFFCVSKWGLVFCAVWSKKEKGLSDFGLFREEISEKRNRFLNASNRLLFGCFTIEYRQILHKTGRLEKGLQPGRAACRKWEGTDNEGGAG